MTNQTTTRIMSGFIAVVIALATTPGSNVASATEPRQWSVHEIELTAQEAYANPYTDVELTATLTGPGNRTMTVRGFWDGGSTFRVRWTPPIPGDWRYSIVSNPADQGLTKSGQLHVEDPQADRHGFLRRDVEYPTSFSFDDGTRCFMWGTTYYHLVANVRAGDHWQEAVDGAMRYGINKARFSLANGGGTKKSGGYPESGPFTDEKNQRLDIEHWRAADRAIQYMLERGFLADLILFWRMDEKAISEEKRAADEQYLRYALARYAAYPNVIWCMVNEWNYSSVPREYWNDLGRLVREEDPWSREGQALRAHSIHQQTRPDWNFTDQDWPSHAIIQLGVRNRGESIRVGDEWKAPPKGSRPFVHGDDWGNHSIVRNWTGTYPVVNDEYGYIGEPFDDSAGGSKRKNKPVRFTRDKHRRTMWGIAAGGGYAAAGDKNSYEDGSPYFSANWHDTPEYTDVQHLINFFTDRGIEYWKMAPHNETVERGRRVYVLAEPGRSYVIYAAAGGEFSVEIAEGTYRAMLFDPRTGAGRALPDVQGEAVRSFTTPEGDWVLHLQSHNEITPQGDDR